MNGAGTSREPVGAGALVLVCFALKEEAAPFHRFASSKPWIDVLVTGIGRRNTEEAIAGRLSKRTPTVVLTCGFAGGLDRRLRTGDVLFDTTHAGLQEVLLGAGARPGRFYCGARIATSAEEKARLRESSGADAVEMESAHVRLACDREDIPVATVRVVLDTASEDLPLDFSRLMTSDERLSMPRLALALLTSPGKVVPLARLRRQSRAAAEALAEVLEKTVEKLAR